GCHRLVRACVHRPGRPGTPGARRAGEVAGGNDRQVELAEPSWGGGLGLVVMRVLVSGGAGFIGSHLTDALAARGDEVVVVDDLSAGRVGRLEEGVVLHKVSITDAGALAAVMEGSGAELVCHL